MLLKLQKCPHPVGADYVLVIPWLRPNGKRIVFVKQTEYLMVWITL